MAAMDRLIEPLIQACIRGSAEDVHQILVDAQNEVDIGTLVNHVNADGFTPITATLFLGSAMPSDVVTSENQENVLTELEMYGADFDSADGNGLYPLYASLCADFPITFFVLNRCNALRRGRKNANFMMYAASMGLNDILDIVNIEFDNKNERDEDGNTAMHHGVLRDLLLPSRQVPNHPAEVAGLLCTLGVDPLIENNRSETAYDLAIERHRYDIALELRHCEFPDDLLRKIKIKMGPEDDVDFIINLRDTVSSVKQAIFFDSYRDYDFIYPNFRRANGKPTPNSMKVLENEREFSDYNIKAGELIIVQPKLRSGARGGKRKTQRKRGRR